MRDSREGDDPVSPLCSRNARSQKTLVGRAQWGTHLGNPGETSTSKLGRIIFGHSLRPCLGQGASLGEEAALADLGWVRYLAFLRTFRNTLNLNPGNVATS
jgi:hypothetical protein